MKRIENFRSKNRMRGVLFVILLIISTFSLFAQTITVKGMVVDALNQPLIGVTILVQGTNNGTTTDYDGNYELSNVPTDGKLVFSYIGMKEQIVAVNNQTAINISMKDNSEMLEEVVVIGYGTQKKSSLTGSVAAISGDELVKQEAPNVASALQGKVAGVDILQGGGEAGANVSVLIRGAATFGSTEPLYVIDGAFSNSGLNSVNPADIKSIEVLKDAAAAAIYGSRASNGVVLITTKNGEKGQIKVDANFTMSYQTLSKRLDFMNSEQWRTFANQVAANSPAYDPAPQNVNPSNPSLSTDWQDIYYQNAPMWKANVAISGGGDKSRFRTSLGYINQEGIVVQSAFKRYNVRVNSTHKRGIFSIQQNLAVAYSKKQKTPSKREILIPTIPVKDDKGRYISTPSRLGYSLTGDNISNPLAEMYSRDNYNTKVDMIGSLGVEAKIYKGFKYKLNLAGNYLASHAYSHKAAYSSFWLNENGEADSQFSQPYTSLAEIRAENFDYTIDNLLTYENDFGSHHVDVLLGTSFMREFYRSMSISSGVNDLGAPSITTYNGEGKVGSNELNSALLSFFTRVNYDYKDKYLLSLSIRRDESSKFAKNYRVGYFPSISAGWNIHKESFFNIPYISKLKIRASYGELGANFIQPYQFLSLAYSPATAIIGNQRIIGVVTRFAQENLTWETSVSSNIGMELGLFQNKLNFSAEYFVRRNKDLLAPLELIPSSGQTIIINDGTSNYYNAASVENKGWEFVLGFREKWGDFSIDTQGNISFLDNKVIALGEGVQPIRGALISSKFNDRPTITTEGLPIGSFWGYKVVGIDDNGDFLYESAEGKAKTAADISGDDKRVIGNPTPDFTFGFKINTRYKNWDLNLFFQGVYGNDIFSAAKYQYYFNYNNNNLADAMNSWTPTNRNTYLPIAKTDNFSGGNALPSTFYIEDGSYLRLKNIQLGYSLNRNQIKKIGFWDTLRVYAGIQNLFTITKYPLYDPEVSSNTLFNRGVDGLGAPPAINSRIFNLGVNVKF